MPKKHEDVSLKGFGGLCATFLVRLAKVAARMSPDLVHNWTRNGEAIERLLMKMIPPTEQELAEAQAVVRRTIKGEFRKDQSGLWHYSYKSLGTVHSAAQDAINHHPAEPAWFWFNDTPAPMFTGDTLADLVNRWGVWRASIQSRSSSGVLDFLRSLSTK